MLRLYGQKDLQQRLEKTFVSVHLKIIIDSCSMTSLKPFTYHVVTLSTLKIIGKEVIKWLQDRLTPPASFL